MENNYPIVTFASDSNIANLQADFAKTAVAAKVETHKVDSNERIELKEKELEGRKNFYMFAISVIFLLCTFQFMQSDAFLELSRDYKNSRAAQLKIKKAQLEKELAELEGAK